MCVDIQQYPPTPVPPPHPRAPLPPTNVNISAVLIIIKSSQLRDVASHLSGVAARVERKREGESEGEKDRSRERKTDRERDTHNAALFASDSIVVDLDSF